MKTLFLKLWLVALVLTGAQPVFGAPAPAKPLPIHSVFVQPANFREGRDPFFPESNRPYESNVATPHPVEVVTLKSPGFSVSQGRRMVIINNHTFAIGDEGDVLTTSGRVHVRCLEIRNDVVIVEANGQRREISFGTK